ncbi:Hsp20/alpha crystallin family protein [Kineosporia sp. NBRC 101731]|uniref:Hsp20/alpha crystallin family protein n=1 Tax=Kineosporia sp. NBRC 101731 TaxID=3032199 RepID=UPI0024A1D655|nr:Hsp20/alpha crystallin family protein [Kineosporia sp. NBRC 101731]GLY29628.1 heat-shock protein Hsp20 [Kineosporia sp. NBRC 101731]
MALPVRSGDAVVRWDPFREFGDIQRQFDQVVQSVFGPVERDQAAARRTWRPLADVTESDSGYVISLEVPGFRKNEIELSVEGDTLTVGGEYALSEDGEQRHARRAGRFQYSTLLPKGVAADQVSASLADGVLRVSVPKSGETQPRRIEITEG